MIQKNKAHVEIRIPYKGQELREREREGKKESQDWAVEQQQIPRKTSGWKKRFVLPRKSSGEHASSDLSKSVYLKLEFQ